MAIKKIIILPHLSYQNFKLLHEWVDKSFILSYTLKIAI